MAQVERRVVGRDLLEKLISWHTGRSSNAELHELIRSFLEESCSARQLEAVLDPELRGSVFAEIVTNCLDSLERSEASAVNGDPASVAEHFEFVSKFDRNDSRTGASSSSAAAKVSDVHAVSVTEPGTPSSRRMTFDSFADTGQSIAAPLVETKLEPFETEPEFHSRAIFLDPIMIYHRTDALVRRCTWDYLSIPGALVVACLVGFGSMPFWMQTPESLKEMFRDGPAVRAVAEDPNSNTVRDEAVGSPTEEELQDASGLLPTSDVEQETDDSLRISVQPQINFEDVIGLIKHGESDAAQLAIGRLQDLIASQTPFGPQSDDNTAASRRLATVALLEAEVLLQQGTSQSRLRAWQLLSQDAVDAPEPLRALALNRLLTEAPAQERAEYAELAFDGSNVDRRLQLWLSIRNGQHSMDAEKELISIARQNMASAFCDLHILATAHFSLGDPDRAHGELLKVQNALNKIDVSELNEEELWLLERSRESLHESLETLLTHVARLVTPSTST